jgi:PncC family amidohydrolase
MTAAVAESSTGGLIGHLLTEVPGSSAVFPGGVIAYHNRLKEALGVPKATLAAHGAVSAQTAEAMAQAVRRWAGTDIGVAETGIAGPTGGSAERPAGLFYVALADAGPTRSERIVAAGDRSSNKQASARAALQMLLRRLEEDR